MIEHVLFDDGQVMLGECYRVLKPGGVSRVVTPDAQFMIGLYNDPDETLHKKYIEAVSKSRLKHDELHNATSIVNSHYRDWGHLYIYDTPVMADALTKLGFCDLHKCEIRESRYSDLCDF